MEVWLRLNKKLNNKLFKNLSYNVFFQESFFDLSKREFSILLTLALFMVLFGIYPNVILDGIHYGVSGLIYSYSELSTLTSTNN